MSIREAADPIRDHALLYYLDAFESVKQQLDEVASVLTASQTFLDGAVAPKFEGEELRDMLKRILQIT